MTQASLDKKSDYLFKIIMLGDGGVGKSQLIKRYSKDEFDAHSTMTVGVEFITQTMTIQERQVSAQIWDTAGQERFASLNRIYYSGAVGAIIVYDITQQKTFDSLNTRWFKEIKNFSDPNLITLLVGNKCDKKTERQVSTDDARIFAEKHSIVE